MNAIKLDLMTALVVFVVIGMVITMILGTDDSVNSTAGAPAQKTERVTNPNFSSGMSRHIQVNETLSVANLNAASGLQSWK